MNDGSGRRFADGAEHTLEAIGTGVFAVLACWVLFLVVAADEGVSMPALAAVAVLLLATVKYWRS